MPLSKASAHEVRPSLATMQVIDGSDRFSVTITTNLEAVIAEIGEAHEDTSDSEKAETYNLLRELDPAALEAEFEAFRDRFLEGTSIRFDGQKVLPDEISVSVDPVGDLALPRDSIVQLIGTVPGGVSSVTWQWDTAFGSSVLRVMGSNGDLYADWLRGGQESDEIPIIGPPELSTVQVIMKYFEIGFVHILPLGLDHILFVVGLFLLSPAWRPLLLQVTAFTVAHSVTLALGVLGLVQLSPSIVEPLIALSIAYICLENLFTNKVTLWRPVIVFGFGLLHGLGFAGVLGEIGLAPGAFVAALVGFNIGVEVGQIAVLLGCSAAVGAFVDKPWYRQRVSIPASILIGLVGLYWTVERVFF